MRQAVRNLAVATWLGSTFAGPLAAEPIPVVIDIRTPGEWRETGVIEGALLMTFFDERGGYDAATFLERLHREIDPDTPVLLVCRTGNRTGAVKPFLEQQGFERVAHVEGGMVRLLDQGLAPVTPPADAFTPSASLGRVWRCAATEEERGVCRAEP
ncbi:MAG: rhodanese-like domain-containing protein [Pseudomonadota bacterium]